MQASQLTNKFMTGPQKKMIGIGQNDFGVQLAGQIALGDALDGGLRADGHEHRCFYSAVRGVNQARTSPGMPALGLEFEMHPSI